MNEEHWMIIITYSGQASRDNHTSHLHHSLRIPILSPIPYIIPQQSTQSIPRSSDNCSRKKQVRKTVQHRLIQLNPPACSLLTMPLDLNYAPGSEDEEDDNIDDEDFPGPSSRRQGRGAAGRGKGKNKDVGIQSLPGSFQLTSYPISPEGRLGKGSTRNHGISFRRMRAAP